MNDNVTILDIPLEKIRPNPFQMRTHFRDEELEELAASIKQHGVISRIRVRHDPTDPNFFQIIFGERRWRASQIAKLSLIPSEIVEATDQDLLEQGIIENLQRADLELLDEAALFQRLLNQEVPGDGRRKYSIRNLAKTLGKPKNYIEEMVAVANLPEDILSVLQIHPRTSRRALIDIHRRLPTAEERAPLIQELKAGRLTTEEVRALLHLLKERQNQTSTTTTSDTPDSFAFQRALNRHQRRMDAALERLQEIVEMSQNLHDSRSQALWENYTHELLQKMQRLQKLLSPNEA